MPALRPEELKALAEQIMTAAADSRSSPRRRRRTSRIGVPGIGRFRTNVYQQRGTIAFALRAIPYEVARRSAS